MLNNVININADPGFPFHISLFVASSVNVICEDDGMCGLPSSRRYPVESTGDCAHFHYQGENILFNVHSNPLRLIRDRGKVEERVPISYQRMTTKMIKR